MANIIYLSDYILLAILASILIVLWRHMSVPNFLALAISSCLAVLAGEGICRLLGVGPPQNFERVLWFEDRTDGLPYSYTPNSMLVYEYPDNPRGYFDADNRVEGTINSKGFRGPDINFRKPKNTTRVAFLGDSFALGFGVRDEDTLPSQFEAAVLGEYEQVEVLNFGVTNTSTPDQVTLLQKYVLSFSPDVVVIVVFLNDTERFGTIDFRYIRFFPRIRNRSYLSNAIATIIEDFIVSRAMIAHYRSGFSEDSSAWEDVKAALREASTLCKSSQIPLVVAIYPVLTQLGEGYPFAGVHETIASYGRSIDAIVVDLLEAFGGDRGPELWVHRTDQHPNEIAHGKAAARLAQAFMESGLLDGGP